MNKEMIYNVDNMTNEELTYQLNKFDKLLEELAELDKLDKLNNLHGEKIANVSCTKCSFSGIEVDLKSTPIYEGTEKSYISNIIYVCPNCLTDEYIIKEK